MYSWSQHPGSGFTASPSVNSESVHQTRPAWFLAGKNGVLYEPQAFVFDPAPPTPHRCVHRSRLNHRGAASALSKIQALGSASRLTPCLRRSNPGEVKFLGGIYWISPQTFNAVIPGKSGFVGASKRSGNFYLEKVASTRLSPNGKSRVNATFLVWRQFIGAWGTQSLLYRHDLAWVARAHQGTVDNAEPVSKAGQLSNGFPRYFAAGLWYLSQVFGSVVLPLLRRVLRRPLRWDKQNNSFTAAIGEHASCGFSDNHRQGEDFDEG
jgi:hypothetical protein